MSMILRAWAQPMSESWTRRVCASHGINEDKKKVSKWSMDGSEQVIDYGIPSQACSHSFGGGTCSRISPTQFSSFMSSYTYEELNDDGSDCEIAFLFEGPWLEESQ